MDLFGVSCSLFYRLAVLSSVAVGLDENRDSCELGHRRWSMAMGKAWRFAFAWYQKAQR